MRALAYLVCVGAVACTAPIGQHHHVDGGTDSGFHFGDAPPQDAPGTPRSCKEAYDRGGATDGLLTIDPDGPDGSGAEMQVYCDQTTGGGGWMLVMVSGFTNYGNFSNGGNAMSPHPTWTASGGTPTSTSLPTNPTQLGAMDFAQWATFGSEFMVTSSINHWITCTPGTGSLVTETQGTVNCTVVKNVPTACQNVAPDHFFKGPTGPELTRGTNGGLYYYFDSATNGYWPTHDPCGQNQTNQLKGATNPVTAIYLR